MQKEILDFYTTTKVDRLADAGRTGEVPITHVKIFHKQYPRMPRVALPEFSAGG